MKMALFISLSLCCCVHVGWAAERGTSLGLEQRIEAIEKIDQELVEADQNLKSAKSKTARHQIEDQIQELKTRQERLLQELEQIVGPLPPSVNSEEPLVPLEQQLQASERRQDKALDSNAASRLPSK